MLREGPVEQKILSGMDQGAQAPRWMPGGSGSWTHSDIFLWFSQDEKKPQKTKNEKPPKNLIKNPWSGLLPRLRGEHARFSR